MEIGADFFNGLLTQVQAVGTFILEIIKLPYDLVKSVVDGIWAWIQEKLGDLANWINDTIIQPIISFFQPIWDKMVEIFGKIKDWVNNNVIQPVLSVVLPIYNKIKEIFEKIWEIGTTIFGVAKTWVMENVINPLIDKFNAFKDKVVNKVTEIKDGFVNKFREIYNYLYDRFIGPAQQWFTELWNKIVSGVTYAKDRVVSTFNNIVNFIKGIVQNIKDMFSKAWDTVANAVGGVIKGVVNGILVQVEKFINGFIRGINGAIDVINAIPGVSITRIGLLSLPRFAEGGFPEVGQLFVAREAGPELVGNIGNRAAVANNDQITEGIRQASYEGISQAMRENRGNSRQPVNVYIGNKKIYSGYGEYAQSEADMYGRSVRV